VIDSSGLGDAEPNLGEKLRKVFLNVLLESGGPLAKIIRMNTGIFFTTDGSPVLINLKRYEERGKESAYFLLPLHEEQKAVASLGEKELFGVMSVLTDEPELVSVTAGRDCLLLTIDRRTLFELITDRPEISRGIIRALGRRCLIQIRLIEELLYN
jgi:CRP-like cAMP-binding protein